MSSAQTIDVVAGNVFPKYTSRNPLVRLLVANFRSNLRELAEQTGAHQVHEVGCGEGFLARQLAAQGFSVRGSDLSGTTIAEARQRSAEVAPPIAYQVADLYQLSPERDAAELVICCEVLEHLPDTARALSILRQLARPYLIVSVPKEPLWRILNMLRGKYWSALGNTPGHLQHWTRDGFTTLLRRHFDVLEVRAPLPWTMALCRIRQR
ncbi:MAG: class I SAM-dependent methyltransferase [Pseudomonadota bacterium]